MKKIIFKTLRYAAYSLLGIIGFLLIYFAAAFALSYNIVNKEFTEAPDGVEIYVLSNGVHADLVLPMKNEFMDWTQVIDMNNTESKNMNMNLIAFGWGDKGFYLETKTWGDLKFSTAFKALFWLSSSAMHVTGYSYTSLKENEKCKKIKISPVNYMKLVAYIKASFSKNETEQVVCISNRHYATNDAFYEAIGTYSLFYTCNTWTNDGLKHCGVKTCSWTPFDKGILKQFDKKEMEN